MWKILWENIFFSNYTYSEICQLMKDKHKISLSLSSLKRIIYSLGLRRKGIQESDIEDICVSIIKELHASGYNLGYRALWSKLKKKYFLQVKRDTVYEILQLLYPDGLENRFANRLRRRQYLSPGPNFAWHLDGYDKLKPYGFAIHGCVDGYSRHIMWLEVARTNNDPCLTAYYFLKSLKKYKCLPTIVRSDKGTENIMIESLQVCLRKDHDDKFSGENSYIKGKSVHNQRIESYWGRMRQHSVDFYIQFFKYMIQENLFDGSEIQKKCLQYTFGCLIQNDLRMTQKLWNEHRIRKQAAQNNVAGKPYILYNLPGRYGATDYSKDVDMETIEDLMELTKTPVLVNSLFKEKIEKAQWNMENPNNPEEALQLYMELVNFVKDLE